MNFKSLLNKIIDKGKVVLAQPTMLWIDKENIGLMGKHTVEQDEAGRIDLISLLYYDSDEHIDYLLKFNGISDPLSINEGDILLIPTLGPNYKKLERPKTAIDNIVRQEFLDGKRLTKKDKRRVEFLKKKYKIKEVLPPNVLKSGFKTFKFTEKNGEKATEMGMSASTPDSTYTPKDTSSTAKSLGSAYDDSWKKVDGNILDKNLEDLTLKDVSNLQKAGINLDKFEDAKKSKQVDDIKKSENFNNGETFGNTESKSSKDVFDKNGNLIGKESTIKTVSIDSGKKNTTITTTIVRQDGTSETKQIQTFEPASEENLKNIQEFTNKNLENNSNDSQQNTDQGLENKINDRTNIAKKQADKYNSNNKERKINPDKDGGTR